MKVLISTLAVVGLCALPAEAQVKLNISNGRVNLEATNVPARQILAEWARIGGTRIVGGEKVTGAPVTLKLVDMPERQALEIILRNVAGFMAAPRLASATPGASTYDRILIMATSSAPAPATNAAARGGNPVTNGNAMNGSRRVPQRPPNLPPSVADDSPGDDEQRIEDDQADTGMAEPPVFTFPAPGAQPGTTPVFTPVPTNAGQAPGAVAPVITLQPGQNGPTIYNFVPNEGQQPASPTPNNPFGVIGAPQPGMIQMPAPTPAQPGRPPTTRPPGGA
jgi:hypothetical protein